MSDNQTTRYGASSWCPDCERERSAGCHNPISRTTPPMPALIYAPTPCPKCGAATAQEAEGRCRPTRDYTDEYTCPGGDEDERGNLIQPTAESIAAMDEWIDRYGQ